jgi:hypothetical protein
MKTVFQCVYVFVMCLFAVVLGAELMTQFWPEFSFIVSGRAQDTPAAKMVLIDPNLPHAAVRVIKVMENGQEIQPGRAIKPDEVPGQQIIAGEDWLSNLSFVVKNRTAMRIDYMKILVFFREDQHYDRRLEFGQIPPAAMAYFGHPPFINPPKGSGSPLKLGPGQEMTISLAGYVDAIKMAKRTVRPFSSLTKCAIFLSEAYFDDPQGLRWAAREYSLPDPNSSEGYRLLPSDYFPGDLELANESD